MHDECKVFAEALKNAAEAMEIANESIRASRDRERETAVKLYNLNSRLILAIILVSAIIVSGFVDKDYIQYSASYETVPAVNNTQIAGDNNKLGGDINGTDTKATPQAETTQAP